MRFTPDILNTKRFSHTLTAVKQQLGSRVWSRGYIVFIHSTSVFQSLQPAENHRTLNQLKPVRILFNKNEQQYGKTPE